MNFLVDNFELVKDCIIFSLAVVSFIVTLFIRKNVSSAVKSFKEVEEMKYKTVGKVKSVPQTFNEEVKDYILNPATNQLEELPIPKNVQDYIQSFVDCALERFKDKFLPSVTEERDDIADYTQSVSDLSSLAEAMEVAEDYRDRFNLPDDYSMADIYGFVDKHSKELSEKLKNLSKEDSDDGESEKTEVK